MDDTKADPTASRREFISNAGTTPAAANVLPAVAAITSSSAAATPKSAPTPVPSGLNKRGAAGELHQLADGSHSDLTTNQGLVITDDENSLKIGARGSTSLEDFILRERSITSTMNAFRSVWSTLAARALTGISN